MLDGHNSAFDWDSRFMRIAVEVSSWSKDPDTKVGTVIVSEDGRKISWGYNGFPRGIEDDSRLNDRELKRKLMVHAELNALSNADFPLSEAALYSTMYPCHVCAGPIIQSGIALVVAPKALKHWENSQSLAALMFREAGIGVRELEMENGSSGADHDDLYTRISKMVKVNRNAVKRIILAAGYSPCMEGELKVRIKELEEVLRRLQHPDTTRK